MAGGGSAAVARRMVGGTAARRGYRQDAAGGRRTSDTATGVRCTTHTGTVQDACAAGRALPTAGHAVFFSMKGGWWARRAGKLIGKFGVSTKRGCNGRKIFQAYDRRPAAPENVWKPVGTLRLSFYVPWSRRTDRSRHRRYLGGATPTLTRLYASRTHTEKIIIVIFILYSRDTGCILYIYVVAARDYLLCFYRRFVFVFSTRSNSDELLGLAGSVTATITKTTTTTAPTTTITTTTRPFNRRRPVSSL